MTPSRETRQSKPGRAQMGPGWTVAGWLLGILGAIALFMGLITMFASADSYVGFGGDFSWRVGDISDAWMYGLLIGGAVVLLIAQGIMLLALRGETPTHASHLAELAWHGGIFVVVNAFIWVQDIAIGGGVEYAYWVTIPWGVGLAIHTMVVMMIRHEPRELQPH